MADPGVADTKAAQSCLILRPRHVHVLLFSLIFPGKKTMYHLLCRISFRAFLYLLQLSWELRVLAVWGRG